MMERVVDSPVGRLLLSADEDGLCGVHLFAEGAAPAGAACADASRRHLDEAERQLGEYFCGKRRAFTVPLHLHGTAFEQAVWRELTAISFGQTRSYGQVAAALGRPKASRAVGAACSRNPALIVVPCHRVIAASGKLTGFAAGLPAKRMLLSFEGLRVESGKVI